MNIGQQIEEIIQQRVNILCSKKEIIDLVDIIETDTIGEVIEKLCILHIRNWMLEDLATETTDDLKFAEIKRKIEICYKQKRPKLVEAINKLIDVSIVNNKRLFEESVKQYGHS